MPIGETKFEFIQKTHLISKPCSQIFQNTEILKAHFQKINPQRILDDVKGGKDEEINKKQ